MDRRWRHSEEALHVCFGGRLSVDERIGAYERQVLTLQGCEPLPFDHFHWSAQRHLSLTRRATSEASRSVGCCDELSGLRNIFLTIEVVKSRLEEGITSVRQSHSV